MASPVLIQSVCSPIEKLAAGDTFRAFLPNPTLSGNAIIGAVSWQITTSPHPTLVVSDATNGTYSTTAGTLDTGDAAQGEIFYFLNGTAGVQEVSFAFESGIGGQFVQIWISEWANIATTSALDGSHGQKTTSTTAISPGSFTPLVNGDLIVQCNFSVTTSTAGDTSAPTADTTHMSGVLLHYDNVESRFGVQWGVQTTAAAINPVFTLPTADTCISMGAAFKTASAGSQPTAAGPGVAGRIVRVHGFNVGLATGTTFKTVFPCAQNLLHASWVGANGTTSFPNLSAATDSASNAWSVTSGVTGATSGAGDCNFARTGFSATPASNLLISWTLAHGTSVAGTLLLYDIAIDTAASVGALSGTHGTDATSGVHNISMMTLTPASANKSLWFMGAGVEGGTLRGLSTGQSNDNMYYDSEDATVQNFYENNGWGHFTTSSTGGNSLSWTATSATTNWTINTTGYVASAAAAGHSLFLIPLDGLAGGGPFFRNPIN